MKSKVKEIFDRSILTLDIKDENDTKVLLEYFKNHPEWNTKIGSGFKCFRRVKNNWNQCLAVVDINGSVNTISMNYTLKDNHRHNVLSALRTLIEPEVQSFRNRVNYGVDKCCFTGEILTRENSHIDHYDLDFIEVFNSFLLDCNYLIENIQLEKKDVKYYILDYLIKAEFINYHNCHTNLRCITATANLKRKKSK